MATPAYDSGNKAYSAANVTNLSTPSFTISGSNRLLLVVAGCGAGTPIDPTAVKWGGSTGTALTKLATLTFGTFHHLTLWYLVAPTATTSTVYVNWGTNQDETLVIATSYTGVDQTTPLGTAATNSASAASASVSVAAAVGDLVFAAAEAGWASAASRALTPTAGQTARFAIDQTTSPEYEQQGDSDVTASSTSMSVGYSVSGGTPDHGMGIIGVALKGASGGGATISANADALSLTEQAATVNAAHAISAQNDSLSISTSSATVALSNTITAALAVLTLSELAGAISLDVALSAGLDTLTLSELAAKVALGASISAQVDVLTLSELGASLALDVSVQAAVDTLSISEFTAQLALGHTIQAAADSLGLTVLQSSVALDVDVSALVDSLTVTDLSAVVTLSEPGQINAGVQHLSLSELRATIEGNRAERGMFVRIGRLL